MYTPGSGLGSVAMVNLVMLGFVVYAWVGEDNVSEISLSINKADKQDSKKNDSDSESPRRSLRLRKKY